MGPINEWYTAGFDGGENALIGFSTGMTFNSHLFVHSFNNSLQAGSQQIYIFIKCRISE